MKIVKAQKAVKRLKGEISELQQRISSCISVTSDNDFSDDYETLMNTLNEKVTKLVQLKVQIHKANIDHGIFVDILKLGEFKSRLEFIRTLNPIVGSVRAGYGETEKDIYKTQLPPTEKMRMIEECQKTVNDLTDKLDDFNATTDIADVAVTNFFK